MDYIEFCKLYFEMTSIPVVLLDGNKPLYSSIGDIKHIVMDPIWTEYMSEETIGFDFVTPELEYGRVNIENTNMYIFLGPIFPVPLTTDLFNKYIHDTGIPEEYTVQIYESLSSVPIMNHSMAARHLVFISYCINGHAPSTEEVISNSRETDKIGELNRNIKQPEYVFENEFNETYNFEKLFYSKVADGNVPELKLFLDSMNLQILQEVKLAPLALRHAKNQFIMTAAKMLMSSAIPGGINITEAYSLMGLYVSQCETMQSIEGVNDLQYSMTMEICRRCGMSKIPSGVSKEIFAAIDYIKGNIHSDISVEDIAYNVGLSVSYLMKRFKSEMGITPSRYMTNLKIDEAKNLLLNSDMNLVDISFYLGFSSQSHFQNVFKKETGVTPLQYRNSKKE